MLLRLCRGARHGLTLSGKLARIERQETAALSSEEAPKSLSVGSEGERKKGSEGERKKHKHWQKSSDEVAKMSRKRRREHSQD